MHKIHRLVNIELNKGHCKNISLSLNGKKKRVRKVKKNVSNKMDGY